MSWSGEEQCPSRRQEEPLDQEGTTNSPQTNACECIRCRSGHTLMHDGAGSWGAMMKPFMQMCSFALQSVNQLGSERPDDSLILFLACSCRPHAGPMQLLQRHGWRCCYCVRLERTQSRISAPCELHSKSHFVFAQKVCNSSALQRQWTPSNMYTLGSCDCHLIQDDLPCRRLRIEGR